MKQVSFEDLKKQSIRYIKGVGQSRLTLFSRLEINNIFELLTYYPKEYEDRSRIKNIADLQDGELCSFEGTIVSNVTVLRPRRGMSIAKVSVQDSTGKITAVWFNQHYIKSSLALGASYIFYGKAERKLNKLQISNPVFEKIDTNQYDSNELKRSLKILPVYASTKNLSQNLIRAIVQEALKSLSNVELEDMLPQPVRDRHNLADIMFSLNHIHFPVSEQDKDKARYRLVFEELFMLQLGLLSYKSLAASARQGIKYMRLKEMDEFIGALPFQLTDAQKRVLGEVEQDMESNTIMNRLIQGDVGSGKTIIAVLALFKAVRCGYQGALMVPTEILAEQHYKSVKPLLERFGVAVELLSGSQSKKQKQAVFEGLKNGCINVVIGTHALIEDTVEFYKLGLVITDEQHRFGVRQRSILAEKGGNTDVLVMTATPIPRTLALILYGDLDISIIDELPPGRKPVRTYSVNESMRDRINNFIRETVKAGRQVYIVCPLVEDSEEIEAKSAVVTAEDIGNNVFNDLKVGIIHGKMKPSEKESVMKSFAASDISILVSTTIIEVGVNVPNATLMVIENAERFGLAQLHQLRGRVGRGEAQSYCVLFNQSNSKVARERMKIMAQSNDGFVISEKDLEIRGPGEFFGIRQHGLPELKIANLYKDLEILKLAQETAKDMVAEDPGLMNNKRLKQYLANHFGEKATLS
ncbi:ATP-dependent DNA helicase RecG [Ruminiclostridium sufflavum DSM 19573]|uniref:ATP-dependent DNA helicase RecG n=1 Tax=Ruminiclostridium sufflavum DSM 19573 TaxID=1121337 RepID=A0A318XIJ0_9FIRM|nr:ATP-dependent DNA helicase RecG [Ruminiclostridium sufflavum]PYG86844.1 ATP-dependent DNA helicase RecG [Ruminiclostridium sufflavum DSM 19573]